LVAATVGLLMPDAGRAGAAEGETRNYTIQVDGKHAGDYQLIIQPQPDGALVVSAQSDVRVTVLAVPVYTYSYRGQEVWKNGRLQHFESGGKEKGKDFAVRADADGPGLRVQANGREYRARPDVWTTSWWQLPEARYRNAELPLLGCGDGAEAMSRLQFVGIEERKVGGRTQSCTHYRVVKDATHDLWYDAEERLVRDEWVSGGHATVVEMTELHR
jgi:hypothetical protein